MYLRKDEAGCRYFGMFLDSSGLPTLHGEISVSPSGRLPNAVPRNLGKIAPSHAVT